jgi:hypothetical protein
MTTPTNAWETLSQQLRAEVAALRPEDGDDITLQGMLIAAKPLLAMLLELREREDSGFAIIRQGLLIDNHLMTPAQRQAIANILDQLVRERRSLEDHLLAAVDTTVDEGMLTHKVN